MSVIEIDTLILQSDIDEMQAELTAIKKDMKKMYEAVQTLDKMWDGQANEAFNQAFMSDKADMEDLCETIKRIIECMEFAKKEYNSCENQVKSAVSGIGV